MMGCSSPSPCSARARNGKARKAQEDGWLYSATLITTLPNDVVAKVHNRMPVIFPGSEAERAWLDPSLTPEAAVELCVPLAPDRLTGAPANPKVNKVGKGIEGPELLVAPA